MDKTLSSFSKKIGVDFKNPDLLKQAFVHRSYLNEHPKFSLPHNERLEFLGDAVLELVATEYLYKNYPNPEGDLTNWRSSLVKTENLSKISEELGVSDCLMLSKGEERSANGRGRQVVMANALEALIGSIYLDKGYKTAKDFIVDHILKEFPKILKEKLYIDPKSKLQEITQEKLGITPSYRVISETGPDHDKIFIVGVFVGDKELGRGEGPSKQTAQTEAAVAAIGKSNL